MNNFFKKIQPIRDALNNANPNRKNEFNNLLPNLLKDNIGSGDSISLIDSPIKRIKSNKEVVVKKTNNAFIVLGYDREHIRNSGEYSISGRLDTNSIDLSVGLGYNPEQSVQKNKYIDGVNPDFIHDKSRVYISEGCNIDTYLGIQNYGSKESNTTESKLLSCVAIKSDIIRAVSRGNIKLITGTVLDSDEAKVEVPEGGIELVAINGGDLQPMVLGNNLLNSLNIIITHINNLQTLMSDHVREQMFWNIAVANHVHFNVFKNTPDIGLYANIIRNLKQQTETIIKTEIEKLNSGITQLSLKPISKNTILSSYHKLN